MGSNQKEKLKSTPLPWRQLVVICLVLFANFFAGNVIFPFVPFMIHDFFPTLPKSKLGFYAGFLASAYHLGSFLGNPVWGWLSDKIGRRPVLLIGVLASTGANFLFGFSQNFAWAVSSRLFWGVLNGNIPVAKTYLSEICDDTNQAKAFAFLGMTAGAARLVSVVIGGFLSNPAEKYGMFENEFFCHFPYLLPCLVNVCIGVIALILGCLFLTETLHSTKKDKQAEEASERVELIERNEDQMQETDVETLVKDSIVMGKAKKLLGRWFCPLWCACSKCRAAELPYERMDVKAEELKNAERRNSIQYVADKARSCCGETGALLSLLKDKSVALSVAAYSLYAFVAIISNEVVPLLLVTDSDHGGFCFSSNEIGITLSAIAATQFFVQVFVYHRMVSWFGFKRLFQYSVIVFSIFYLLVPWSVKIAGGIEASNGTTSSMSLNSTLSNGSHNAKQFSMAMPSSITTSGESIDRTSNLTGTRVSPTNMMSLITTSGKISKFTDRHEFSCTLYGYGIYKQTVNDTADASLKECHFVVDGKVQTTAPYGTITAQIWIVVIIFVGFTFLGRVVGFTSINVLVSNSCKRSVRGSVNGLATSGASLARSIGPMIGGVLFAWSESNGIHHFPLNYHFMFLLTVMINFFTVLVTWFLPNSISKQKKEDDDSNQEMTQTEDASVDASVDDSEQADRDDSTERTDKAETCESVV